MNPKFKIGIDVGGTFTDLVAFDEKAGEIFFLKVPSTPFDPSKGVIDALKDLMKKREPEVSLFVHASTIGTNLFLGQLGLKIPKGAVITTEGFKDILEIGRQKRPELYNPFFERPRPLIERHLRFGIKERINFKGEVLKPIDEQEIKSVAQKIKQEKVETIAIVFLHAYINPEHEKKAKEILKQQLPGMVIMTSSEIDPEYREYERMSTTVINSLLVPVVSTYLRKIKNRLKELKVKAPLYIMQSNGGLATFEVASQIPVATIESGPATGVIASAYWSKMLGIENILSFDMGGTTAKAGVVVKGIPQMINEYEVGGNVHSGRILKGSGYPIRYPFIDLAEVSGGGGTIAWIDHGNALRVGPLSAGADPGPACYGKGGENPTVTDANLILGRLNPVGISGGKIKVFSELAEKSIRKKIAEPLGISIVQAAYGIIEIVNTHMIRALRLVSVERGYDPRDFVILAFGGAGPMHAAFLAEGLGVKNIVIPPNPGVFSALGLMLADFRHDFVRNIMKPASEINTELLEKIFGEIEKKAKKILQKEGFSPNHIVMERNLELRYLGQSYELIVPFHKNFKVILQLFHQKYQKMYSYSMPDEPVEVVNIHLIAYGLIRKPKFRKIPFTSSSSDALIDKKMVFFKGNAWIETPIYSRDALLPGHKINGPAIIEQSDATTVIPPGWNAVVDEFLNLTLVNEV
ncbi:5-oxoprolinase [Candidatus Desulfofervidus auxilii]|uniref:5-oxoprolinase n=1 Tax=Desulfofervidus auxilii TaxID=1621989 RepID=A0A7V1I4T1_DESA2|nr:hydantoinase/oxoprolinase family protein [Candidatus Desulfofervidus auxilii]AMM41850.1 5-oxoprolinase [Candidatus Desulfofervidus auxilii]CAD7770239.1 MAG: Acetophenone carboxylase gamma subunit [Candidatus Methanoperedenaceae archaeon GB50]CAD7779882.1 Acetophenone carboxylase gamma subunit [Candidatus Methanoperedenaceae archaeon GB50]HEB74429.1 hydantoinase/oxoprolinase family protein [Candidatus Desulfofervidus auxilii]